MSLLNKVTRELSKQRTVSLFKDQEDKIEELAKAGVKLQYAELIRAGVDLALAQIEKELKDRQ